MKPNQPIILHGFKLSGHSHRAELMLRLLDLPYEFRQVDLAGGEHRRPPFLAMNPFGTVPVIEDGATIVADSVAVLVYLAAKYDPARTWLPADPAQAAEVQRWLSAAQGPVFNGPCAARLVAVFGRDLDHERAKTIAASFFTIFDAHLTGRDFAAGQTPTIADAALYSYIAHAPEGGVSLAPFAHIGAWLKRVESLPNFEDMPPVAAGLVA